MAINCKRDAGTIFPVYGGEERLSMDIFNRKTEWLLQDLQCLKMYTICKW